MTVKENDTVILFDPQKRKKYFLNLKTSQRFECDSGVIEKTQIIGKQYGSRVKTHLGRDFFILPFNLHDYIMLRLNRQTQIVYPKDAAYIVLRLDIKCGDRVIECGTGSGAMTCVLAQAVGSEGKVFSYERRQEFVKNATANLKRAGLIDRVEIKNKDISESGFDEKEVSAVFLDVREPWLYLNFVLSSLSNGKSVCILVPTANQVIKTLEAMQNLPFEDVEVLETLLRKYKTVPERFRPEDRMNAHTAYLIFARKLEG